MRVKDLIGKLKGANPESQVMIASNARFEEYFGTLVENAERTGDSKSDYVFILPKENLYEEKFIHTFKEFFGRHTIS